MGDEQPREGGRAGSCGVSDGLTHLPDVVFGQRRTMHHLGLGQVEHMTLIIRVYGKPMEVWMPTEKVYRKYKIAHFET